MIMSFGVLLFYDLSDWSSKGINYRAEQDALYSKERPYMYAPDVVRGNDGKYYLYYGLSGFKGKGGYFGPISVAVCDTPDGKYEYLGYIKIRMVRRLINSCALTLRLSMMTVLYAFITEHQCPWVCIYQNR